MICLWVVKAKSNLKMSLTLGLSSGFVFLQIISFHWNELGAGLYGVISIKRGNSVFGLKHRQVGSWMEIRREIMAGETKFGVMLLEP